MFSGSKCTKQYGTQTVVCMASNWFKAFNHHFMTDLPKLVQFLFCSCIFNCSTIVHCELWLLFYVWYPSKGLWGTFSCFQSGSAIIIPLACFSPCCLFAPCPKYSCYASKYLPVGLEIPDSPQIITLPPLPQHSTITPMSNQSFS